KIARWELAFPESCGEIFSPDEVGDFWWERSESYKRGEVQKALKKHAVLWYGIALEHFKVAPLKESLIRKRIEADDLSKSEISAGLGNKIGLAHRWSFNGSMKDSVGNADAVMIGNAELQKGKIRLYGEPWGGSYLKMEGDLLPSDRSPYTLEIWATLKSYSPWSRIFQVGFFPGMRCDRGGENQFCWHWNSEQPYSGSDFSYMNHRRVAGPLFELDKMYHIVLVGEKSSLTGSFDISAYVVDSEQGTLSCSFKLSRDIISRDWESMYEITFGHSAFDHPGVIDTNAEYHEIRIWNRALTENEIAASHKAGPDRLPKISRYKQKKYNPTKEPKPTWFGSKREYVSAYIWYRMARVDRSEKDAAKKKLGGEASIEHDAVKEAEKRWNVMMKKK
ncbi:MAG: hypothetical protein ILO34_05665, partial [Kiritimatiellae bacterium]|nr:hypothetical protein [Kiritimatiellia bacterium]